VHVVIEHVSVPVSRYQRALRFYVAALEPLGYTLWQEYAPNAAGFAEGGSASFWISARAKKKVTPIHVAMRGDSKKAVKSFYEAALEAGGKDNGSPGFRPDYGDDYYAAFVLDPDGNNIEACYFGAKVKKTKTKKKAKKSKSKS
jgi:catechol 2,3-dioxygenase-like lactoylglutathione lyase family enzyme